MSSTITQFGLSSAFLLGLYDGSFTFEQLAEHGNFGHGTFHAIDGEMIALNGDFYRIDAQGTVSKIDDPNIKTPIATMTHFLAEQSFILENIGNYQVFQEKIREHLPSQNSIYVLQVEGKFKNLLVRSEVRQKKPYEAIETSMPKLQRKFLLKNTQGTMVGFFVPNVYKDMVLSGFHFHYINDLRDAGGHVLDFEFDQATISLQCNRELRVILPNSAEFDEMDLSSDTSNALQIAEHGGKLS